MSKIDEAYRRIQKFEDRLRATSAFTSSLHEAYDPAATSSFDYAVLAFCTDLRHMMNAVEDMEDYRERLHDVVTVEAERDAIGGGPGFKGRADKAWARASEPFEP